MSVNVTELGRVMRFIPHEPSRQSNAKRGTVSLGYTNLCGLWVQCDRDEHSYVEANYSLEWLSLLLLIYEASGAILRLLRGSPDIGYSQFCQLFQLLAEKYLH
jgi:hypothetical protein